MTHSYHNLMYDNYVSIVLLAETNSYYKYHWQSHLLADNMYYDNLMQHDSAFIYTEIEICFQHDVAYSCLRTIQNLRFHARILIAHWLVTRQPWSHLSSNI